MSQISKWRKGTMKSLPKFPSGVSIETCGNCNMRCLHCYRSHNWKGKTLKNWSRIIDDLILWRNYWNNLGENFFVVFCGRKLNPQGAMVIREIYEKTGDKIIIVDNGISPGIIEFSEQFDLFDCYSQVAISIDGLEEDHDEQRQMKGAFQKTFKNFLKLREIRESKGYDFDLITASVLSKITTRGWPKFEKIAKENDMTLSVTFVLEAPETKKRAERILFSDDDLNKCFDMLCQGECKKDIIIYLSHAKILKEKLEKLSWKEYDTYIQATLENGTTLSYRPMSLSYAYEVDIMADGQVYTAETGPDGNQVSLSGISNEERLKKTIENIIEEKSIWDCILE